jgi:hypothetical protein
VWWLSLQNFAAQRKEMHWAKFCLFLPSFLHFFYRLPITRMPNQCLGLGQLFLASPLFTKSNATSLLFFVNSDSVWISMCFLFFTAG